MYNSDQLKLDLIFYEPSSKVMLYYLSMNKFMIWDKWALNKWTNIAKEIQLPLFYEWIRFTSLNLNRLCEFAYFFGSNRLCNADEKRTITKMKNKKAK